MERTESSERTDSEGRKPESAESSATGGNDFDS